MNTREIADNFKRRARDVGFDLCGIASAERSGQADYLATWLEAGKHGAMGWLEKRFEERADVRAYLPGARSVVSCAMSYNVPLAEPSEGEAAGKIARYALGDDYHEHLKRRLFVLADWLREVAPSAETKVAVDTAPLLEREWAARAGVGWQGKNTCTMNTKLGSYLLLGEIVTTLRLPPDEPAVDRCGTCRRCIDACPTDALAPYALDATRCISYWNIEHRGDIPSDIAAAMGDRLFGCDICQEVCPWNRKAPPATDPAVRPRFPSGTLDAAAVAEWTPEQYREALRGSAMKRVKLPLLQRNARIVLEERGARALSRVATRPRSEDGVAEAGPEPRCDSA